MAVLSLVLFILEKEKFSSFHLHLKMKVTCIQEIEGARGLCEAQQPQNSLIEYDPLHVSVLLPEFPSLHIHTPLLTRFISLGSESCNAFELFAV